MAWPRRTALALMLLALTIAPPSGPASGHGPAAGPIGITLRPEPAGSPPSTDARERGSVIAFVAPGSSLTRTVTVVNSGPDRERIDLYPAGASIRTDTFTPSATRSGNDLSSWTNVYPSTVDVPAHGSRAVKVTVSPPGGTRSGERFAMVWAQPRDGDVADRVGLRMYVAIGRGTAPASDFSIETVAVGTDDAGRPVISANVTNTGGRAVDITGVTTLTTGPDGQSRAPIAIARTITLARGGRGQVTAVLDPPPPSGRWLVNVTLSSGTVNRQRAATVTVPSASPDDRSPAMFGWVALGLLIMAVAGSVAWTSRRRAAVAGP